MIRLLILLALLACVGCSPDDTRYYVEADYDRGFVNNVTGLHIVRTDCRMVGVFETYAEADSVCRVLNEGADHGSE